MSTKTSWLEQVGTPDEVQENPASATVMKFLGDSVEVEPIAEGGRVLVRGQETPVAAPSGVIGPVKLYVRPWQLRFAAPEVAHLTGTVRSSYRTQGRQRIEVADSEGRVLAVGDFEGIRYPAVHLVGLRINGGHVFGKIFVLIESVDTAQGSPACADRNIKWRNFSNGATPPFT